MLDRKRSVWEGACQAGIGVERLEGRMLLSASLQEGVLTVIGSNKSDSIEIVFDSSTSQLRVLENEQVTRTIDTTQESVTKIVVYGGNGDDLIQIVGTAIPANLLGGNGNDQMQGGNGADTLDGGNGNDQLDGGDGNDLLYGGNGCDQLAGGIGDDTLQGGRGWDQLDDSSGNNQFVGDGDKITDHHDEKAQGNLGKAKQSASKKNASKHSDDNSANSKGEDKGKGLAWGKQKGKHR
ncbi:MAG TPA: calcium-binding protein [Tepidisphaeraceae bacterium]|nr:calcium-binding protein [Tepidisphaeraceae bacterium]